MHNDNINNNNDKNIIELCSKFMLTHENMQHIITSNSTHISDIAKKNDKHTTTNNYSLNKAKQICQEYYSPNGTDKLFWCFYKIIYPEWDDNCNFKLEKDFKISCIEKMRKIKPELKVHKLTLVNIENELLNEKKIGLQTLLALCILYKINLIYTWKNMFTEINSGSDDNNFINVINNIDNIDSIPLNSNNKIEYYRENYLYISNPNKPIKAASSYTHKELSVIAKKLQISTTNLNTKKELYEKILEKI